MSSTLLPVELVSKVVKNPWASGDVPTVQSCALVCKVWHSASRSYILHDVTITRDARMTELEDLLEREPAVAALIRALTVRPNVPGTAPAQMSQNPWPARMTDNLPSKLTNLSAINVVGLIDFGDVVNRAFVNRLASFASVERLSVKDCTLNMATVLGLASAFPNLVHLHIGLIVPLPLIGGDEPCPQLHPPRLVSLHADVGEMYPDGLRDFADWVMTTPSRDTLRSLRIVLRPMTIAAGGIFIRQLGPQLEELDVQVDVQFPAPVESEVVRFDLSLATCARLRVLTLRHRNPLSRTVLDLLGEVPAPGLESLTLGVLAAGDAAALPDFAPLQAHIKPAWMHSLVEERVLCAGALADDVVLAKMRRDLPALHAHGTLKVVRE